jgi:hypothetical protein
MNTSKRNQTSGAISGSCYAVAHESFHKAPGEADQVPAPVPLVNTVRMLRWSGVWQASPSPNHMERAY